MGATTTHKLFFGSRPSRSIMHARPGLPPQYTIAHRGLQSGLGACVVVHVGTFGGMRGPRWVEDISQFPTVSLGSVRSSTETSELGLGEWPLSQRGIDLKCFVLSGTLLVIFSRAKLIREKRIDKH
jgi:hypothetical protein